MLLSHGVLPLITLPTRVTDVRATIIDQVAQKLNTAWNSISMEIQNLSKHSFKVKLKESLLQYCTSDYELNHLL